MNADRIENIQRLMEQKIEKRRRNKQNANLSSDSYSSISDGNNNIEKRKKETAGSKSLLSILLSLPRGRLLNFMETFVNSFELYLFIIQHIINYLVPKKAIKERAAKLVDKLSKIIIFLRLQVVLFKILKIVSLFRERNNVSSEDDDANTNTIELIDKAHEKEPSSDEQMATADQDIKIKKDKKIKENDVFEQVWNTSTDKKHPQESIGEEAAAEFIPENASEDSTVISKKEELNQLVVEIVVEVFDLVCLWKNVSFIDIFKSMFGKKDSKKKTSRNVSAWN